MCFNSSEIKEHEMAQLKEHDKRSLTGIVQKAAFFQLKFSGGDRKLWALK